MKFYVRRRASPIITIIPMIDILTILLIFFIVTTTFKNPQPQIQIVVPEMKTAVDKPSAAPLPPILALNSKGDVFLEDKPIEMGALGEAVKKLQQQNRPPILRADEKAPVGRLFEVLDELKLAGIEQLPTAARVKK